MIYEDMLALKPYSLSQQEKDVLLKSALKESLEHHFSGSSEFQKICRKKGFVPPFDNFDYSDIPYLPVGIFKNLRLASVSQDRIVRTLNSSATSSQIPSTVFIDDLTRKRQMKTLSWLISEFLGNERQHYVIFDANPMLFPRNNQLSARNAAIRGFLIAASKSDYFMNIDEKNELSVDILRLVPFLEDIEKQNKKIVIFGFTYVLFVHVARQLQKQGIKFSLKNATIVHIGGWKKLQNEAVSKDIFNRTLSETFGVPPSKILDSYGFTEQLGIIYVDCEDGLKRCPIVSEIIVRDPDSLQPLPDGEDGLIEFITPLPYSYPGTAILLDDIGCVVTRVPDAMGRMGTAFEVRGRAKTAEVRGCGDIMSEKVKVER